VIDHQVVVHLHVPLQEDHRAAVLHRIVLALVVHLHLLHVRNLVKSVLPAEVVQTALVLRVKFLKVVKSAIHAGFVPLHKNAISREFVHASSNQIFLKMSLVKSLKRVFVQNF
jgi:hypothetical protein